MPEYLISPEDYLAEVSGAKPLAVSPEDYLNEVKAAPRFPLVGASAPAPKPVKAPASYQIQADEPPTPKPVGPPMISTRRILRQKPALPESMQSTAIEKAADLIEGVPVVGPLLTAPVRLAGITPTPPQPAQTYEGERGQSLEVGANWRPSGDMGNTADDVRSVRDNMLRQPFGMGEAIEKSDVPWYAGGDLTKGALKAASGLVDSPEAMLTLGALPAGFHALKGGGVAPRAAVTAAELEFAKGGIESGLEAAQDPNKSFLEKAGEIGAQGVFAGGMIAGAGRTMRPEIARVESAVTDVARDRTAKAQGLPFAPPEPTDIQRTWAQFRQLDPGERWQDVLSTLPDNDLKAAALGEENPFRKGMAAQEIKRRERLNVWRPTVEAPEQPLNRATRRETAAIPEPDLQMVADELGLGAFDDLAPDVQAQVRGLRDEASGLDRGPSVKLAEPSVVEPAAPTGKQSLQVPRPAAPPLEMPPSAEYRDMRAGVQSGLRNMEIARRWREEVMKRKAQPEQPPLTPEPINAKVEPNGTESTAVATRSGDSGEGAPLQTQVRSSGHVGAESSLFIPGEDTEYRHNYAVRELEDVAASHNGHTFQPNPRYGIKNERNYSDPANQERIVLDSQDGKFKPAYLLNNNPDATNGPPVLDQRGNTLGGNSRVMKLERVYGANGKAAQAYREQLIRDAAQYGLDPEQIRGMKNPVLVREIGDEVMAQMGASDSKLVRDTNKTGTAALTPSERSAADAKALSPDAVSYLQGRIESEGPTASLRDVLGSAKGAEIINKLVDDGVFTAQEKPQLVDAKTGAVTALAKDRIEQMMLGRMFRDSDQYQRTPPAIREKLLKIAAPLTRVEGHGDWNILPHVQEALDLLEYSRTHGIKDLRDLTKQTGMFEEAPKFSEEAMAVAEKLQESTAAVREAFKSYAEASDFANDPSAPMFGAPERGPSFDESFRAKGGRLDAPSSERFALAKDEPAREPLLWSKFNPEGDPSGESGYDLISNFEAGSVNAPRRGKVSIYYKAEEQFPTFDVVIEEQGSPTKRGAIHRESFDWVGEESAKLVAERFLEDNGFDAPRVEGKREGFAVRPESPGESRIGQPDIQKAFGPKAEVFQLEDGTYRVTRNGFEINVHPNLDYIEINPETVRRDYGRNAEAGERAVGRYVRIDRAGLIQLAKRGGDGAILDHEVFHAAMDMALTPSEKAGVLKRYGTEEAAAEAYSALKADAPAGLYFAKIRAFFQRMVDMVTGRAEGTLRKVARGDVWERGGKEAAGGMADNYAMAQRFQNNADKFEAWLSDHGIEFSRRGGSGSQYFSVELPDGDQRGSLTIRFSDHQQPRTEKGQRIGGFDLESGVRHEASDFSVAPGEEAPAAARKAIQDAYAADWKDRSNSANQKQSVEDQRTIKYLRPAVESRRTFIEGMRKRLESGENLAWDIENHSKILAKDEAELAKLERRQAKSATLRATAPTERYAMRAEPLGILDPEPPQKPPAKSSAEAERTEEPRRLTISPNADESVANFIEHSGLSASGKRSMAKSVNEYMEANPKRERITDKWYRDRAEELGPEAVKELDASSINAENMPPRETMEAVVATEKATRMEIDRLTREREGPLEDKDRKVIEAELDRLEDDQSRLLGIILPVRSEHGRNLRMWGQMALDNLDPVAWIARARRMAGLPGGVALPGKVEGEIAKALGDNRIAEADAIQQITAIDRGKQKMKEGAEKPKAEKPVVELSREERVEQAKKQTIKRLQAELNGKRITDTLTPEERALIADDLTVKQLREQVHELRAKNKPIKTADEMVAAEIERERKRLSKVLEGEPVTARVDKLTPEQRKLVDADQGLQSLRARIQERRAQDRLKKQKTPEEKAIESEVKRADTLTAKEDGTYQPKVVTKAELTPEQRARVNHDPRVLEARKRLFEAMKKSQQQSKLDVISMVRRAGLLTAPKTWLRNIGGNTAFALSEELSRIPASILDAGLSVVSGNGRTVQGMSLNAMRKATYEAATRGTQEFMDVMRDGATADQLAQFDFRREMNSGSKVLDTYVNTVMRFMSAQDRVFKRYAFERSLQEQMKLAGVDKPTEVMDAQAVSDAEFATFNNRNKIAKSFSQWKAGMGDGGRFAVDMIVPFSQTPSNVILRGLDYTPIGAVGRMVGAAWKTEGGLTPELQRSISMAFGRGAVGSALLLTGYLLAKKNLATGNRPQNPAEARADETARRQWGAVKMGDHWRQLTAISPVGALITTGAAMYEAQHLRVTGEDEEEKSKKRLGHAGMAIVKTVEDMPMLQGVQMVDAWRKDPFGSGERVAGRMAGSFVPTIAADIAAAADPVRRDAKGFWAQVAARTPARLMLPEKVDALGKPIEQNRFAAIDPTLGQRAAEDSDPLLKAIVDEQMTFGVPPKKAGESEESYRFRLKVLGAAREFVMRSAMASDQFRGAQSWRSGSDERREILGDATRQAASGINKALGKDYKEQPAEEQMRRLREVADGLKVQ